MYTSKELEAIQQFEAELGICYGCNGRPNFLYGACDVCRGTGRVAPVAPKEGAKTQMLAVAFDEATELEK